MNFRKEATSSDLPKNTQIAAQKMLKKASFMLKKQLKHPKTNGVIKQGKGG